MQSIIGLLPSLKAGTPTTIPQMYNLRSLLSAAASREPVASETPATVIQDNREGISPPSATGRIDVHSHFLPPVYAASLKAANITRPDGIESVPSWSELEVLSAMDRLGISCAMLSISSPGVHFGDDAAAIALARKVNDAGAKLTRKYSGRFGFFAVTPLPAIDAAVAEARYALDTLKADGIVLETNFHGAYLGSERLAPLYAELDAREAVVFIHPTSPHCPCCESWQQEAGARAQASGYPRPMLEFVFETTRTVTDMVLSGIFDRYPRIKVIVPHAGAALPVLAGRVDLIAPSLPAKDGPRPSMRARSGWCAGPGAANCFASGRRSLPHSLRQRLALYAH